MALKFAAAGADVWGLDVNEESLAALADEAEKHGRRVTTRRGDVTDRASLRAVREEAVKAGSGIAVWINNAGIAGLGDFSAVSADEFARVIGVNLDGAVNGTRLALEVMETAGAGVIVNMASVAGHLPGPYMSAYCASKHAVVGFTRSLQAELKLKGSPVRMLLVSPGFVDTGIIAKGEELGYPEWLGFMLASPESVAAAVINGIRSGRDEIYPTFNGKLMKRLYGLFPGATVASSRVLLSKNWRDLLTNRLGK
jgi:short-subunit dehydrogenase